MTTQIPWLDRGKLHTEVAVLAPGHVPTQQLCHSTVGASAPEKQIWADSGLYLQLPEWRRFQVLPVLSLALATISCT